MPLFLLLILSGFAKAQPPRSSAAQNPGILFWNMSPKSVDMLLKRVPQTNALRLAQLKQTFADLQCRHLREQSAPDIKNLICILPAAAPQPSSRTAKSNPNTILFIAHYEHEGSGQSAVENWSGALMLPFLFHALSAVPRHHTFLFAEVDGEPGADALFDSLTLAWRSDLFGVVALDALGLGPAQFYINPNDTSAYWAWIRLQQPLLLAAADQRLPPPPFGIPGGWFKTDDTRAFRHHNIPAILIHSVSRSARQIPNSARDTAPAIDREAYRKIITMLSDYAAELDRLPASQ